MADKTYDLCVELTIDGQKQLITLAKGNLLALEKYTSFCSNPLELLRTMPDKEEFSSKEFINRYVGEVNEKSDPFSIRTSSAKGSRKLPLLYKKDIDILLSNNEEISRNIRSNYKFTIDDVESNNIDEKTKFFLKELWNLFYDQKIMDDFYEYVDNKLNPDKTVTFDKRYQNVLNNRWMILGLSKTILGKFIKLIFKDPRKRIEFLSYLKEKHRELIPEISISEKQKRLQLLEKELIKKGISTSKIRKQINENLYSLNNSLIPKIPEIVVEEKTYDITEQDIISYNEKRSDLNPIMERIIKLSKELERLKLELLIAKGDIKEKIEERISQVEFEIYELENNKYSYTDSGMLIKEDEMIK